MIIHPCGMRKSITSVEMKLIVIYEELKESLK